MARMVEGRLRHKLVGFRSSVVNILDCGVHGHGFKHRVGEIQWTVNCVNVGYYCRLITFWHGDNWPKCVTSCREGPDQELTMGLC